MRHSSALPIPVRFGTFILAASLPHLVHAKDYDGYFDLMTGFSTASMDWNIASDLTGSSTPNIISELTWDNMMLGYIALDAETALGQSPWVLRSRYQLGYAFDGDNQDSDYNGDNRTLEFSRSNNSAGGYTSDWLLGVGYRYSPDNENWALTPSLGYSSNRQHFSVTDGYQTIGTTTGPFDGLDSYFDSIWEGPSVGLRFDVANPKTAFSAGVEYVFADYYGYGNWNLRNDLAHPKSFEHFSDGTGLKVNMRLTLLPVTDDLELSLEYSYQSFELNPGTIQFNSSNGTSSLQRLNGGTTDVQYVGVSINRLF